MNPVRIAQVAVVRATTEVDDDAVRAFTDRFSDALSEWMAIGVPFGFDAFTVTTRLAGPHAFNRLRGFLLDSGLPDASDDRLADALEAFEAQPVEAAVTAHRERALQEVTVRFLGPWTRRDVWKALPRFGLPEPARVAYDRARGALRGDDPLSVALVFSTDGVRVDVELGRRFLRSAAVTWVRQLGHAAEVLGLSDAQRGWLPAQYERLASREMNTGAWTISVADRGVLPRLRVTVPRVPHTVALRLMPDLGGAPGFGARLGALAAGLEIADDEVWRLHLEGRDIDPPWGWFEVRG